MIGRLKGSSSWPIVLTVASLAVAFVLYPRIRQRAAGAGVTEIVYWTPGSISDAMKAAIEEFERRKSQYRVVTGTATVRDAVGDPTRFLLGVAGGVPPDLIYFDRFAVVEWASRGAFTDLTPYIEADGRRPGGIRADHYVEPAWREPIYRGRNYAIANSVDTRGLYYNRDALIRAGFVYESADAEVVDGRARAGAAKPPATWEELCLKKLHVQASATPDGTVVISDWVRRPAVNESVPDRALPDLVAANVAPGDVVALVVGSEVFRARVAAVVSGTSLQLDLVREQPPDLSRIPAAFTQGTCELKIFDRDSYMVRLTRFDPATGRLKAVGFIPLFGNSWLYMYGWLNGAEFMRRDGTECSLDSPEIVAALQFMTDMYDVLGGVQPANVFRASATSGALDPFLTGQIAMRIDGDWFMGTINAFKPRLDFGVVPSPIPESRRDAGHQSVGWIGGWAYAIPATAKHKEPAWELARWLTSLEANQLMIEFEASVRRAQGQVFVPRLHPDRRVMEWVQTRFLAKNPSISDDMRHAYRTFVELLPRSKYRPVTPVGQKLWNEHMRATEAAINHARTPYEALNYGKRQVQIALDRFLNPPTGPPVPWRPLITAYVCAVFIFVAVLVGLQERKRRRYGGKRRQWLEGYMCASPWLFGFVVFGGGPILFSLIISFCHYDVLNPARFIRLTNYVNLLGSHFDPVVGQAVPNDPLLWKSLANTAFMAIGVPLGIVVGLALALLLDRKVRGMSAFRTLFYMPAIVPAVASFILWLWVFDPGRGLLNHALRGCGLTDLPNWLQDPVWAKPSLILMGLWGAGSGMIIWLAGLSDIPESLYEAASIDGANRFRRFRHITIPLLTPYIFFNLVMGMIGVFQVFEAAYIMTDGGPADATLFYAYKLFNEAFRYLNMGTASAMAWILFVVVLAITLLQLWLSKKWVHYRG